MKVVYKIGGKVIYIPNNGKVEIRSIEKISPAGNVIVNRKTFLKSSGAEFNKKFDGDHIIPFTQKGFDDIQTLENKFLTMGLE